MTQHLQDRDPLLTLAIDRFVNSGLSDPLFSKTLLLAFTRGWSHEQALQFLAAVSVPPGPVQWHVMGHPTPERCATLATALSALADTLQTGSVSPETAPMACGSLPDLRVYALIHAPLAVAFSDLVEVLGSATSAERLRWFAGTLRSVSMVS
jgi:hypothetical protein